MSFACLQKSTGSLDVLVLLREVETADVSTLLSSLRLSHDAFYSAMEKLKRLGFVFERKERGFPSHVYFGLTIRGREVAEHLGPVSTILAESLEGLRSELADLREAPRTPESLGRIHELAGSLHEKHFLGGEWKEARSLAEEALEAAQELGEEVRIAQASLWLGKLLQKQDDDECAGHLKRAQELAEKSGVLGLASEASYLRGCHAERKGRRDEALSRFESCVELASRAGDSVCLAAGEAGIGRLLAKKGHYRQSYDRLQSARRRLEAAGELDELPRVLAGLGTTCLYLDAREGLEWQVKAIALSEVTGDQRTLSFAAMNAAGCCLKLGEDEKKAENYLVRAQEVAEKIGEEKLMSSIALQYASLYQRARRWKAAEEHLERALRLAEANGYSRDMAFAFFLMGVIEEKRGQPRRASKHLKAAAGLFGELGDQAMTWKVEKTIAGLTRR